MRSLVVGLACLTGTMASRPAMSDVWTGFRGSDGASVSRETGLPAEWSESAGILWSAAVPGEGNSSPAVTNRRIYLTSFNPESSELLVLALDRQTGDVLWQKVVGQGNLIAYGPPELYRYRHNPATASPCADDEDNVYAFFGTGDLVSFDRDGNFRWQRNLADEYGPYDLKFGMGSSPRLYRDKLLVACVHKGPSYVVALEKDSGKEIWLADRNYVCLGDATDAYTTPAVLEVPGQPPLVVVSGADHVDAYDIETGKRVWENGGLVLENEEYARTIASPAVGDGMVVAPSAKAKLAIVVDGTSRGDITGSDASQVREVLVDCPSPTVFDGRIYSVRDDGVGTCLDLKTGKQLWKNRIGGERYQASPVVGDGKVYFLSLEGKCTVVPAGDEFEVVSENVIPGQYYATPAISNGVIFLRDRSRVIAIAQADQAVEKFAYDYKSDPAFPKLPAEMKLGPVSGVGVDSQGRVIVLQREKPPVLRFEPTGELINSFGGDVIGSGHGLTVDADDNIWVTDTVHHVVFCFSPQGKMLQMLGKLDQASEDADKFNKPTYIIFGPKQDQYVMDGYGNARIVHYRPGGKNPEIWGKPGNGPLEFNAPHAAVIDRKGRLVVCDRDNNRIQILHAETGELLDTWTGFTPFGIAIDSEGTIFISDAKRQQIMQLDSRGQEVRAWGKEGTGAGEFKTPHLITADQKGNLYAAEVSGRRVQKLARVAP